jgi:hypothetical protein
VLVYELPERIEAIEGRRPSTELLRWLDRYSECSPGECTLLRRVMADSVEMRRGFFGREGKGRLLPDWRRLMLEPTESRFEAADRARSAGERPECISKSSPGKASLILDRLK